MDNMEFRELLKKSKLSKVDAAKVLGVGRQTIYNWLGEVEIPESKIEFVRNMLSKTPEELKGLSENDGSYAVENLLPYVVKHFDEFMAHEDFHRKVYIKAYGIAKEIIESKKD